MRLAQLPRVSVLLALACAACDPASGAGAGGDDALTSAATTAGTTSGSSSRTAATGATAATAGSATSGTTGGGAGVDVIFAQGSVGRTLFSCDGGRTYVADRSDDPDARCGDALDCDHHPGSPTGLVVTGGVAIVANGWGTPGVVRTSADGVTWQSTLSLDFPFSSLAQGGGLVMGAAPLPMTSADGGASWHAVPDVYLAPPLRQSVYLPERNRFLLTSEGNGLHVHYTDDAGVTFTASGPVPDGCIAWRFLSGNGVLVMQHGTDGVCRSDDGGATWTVSAFGSDASFSSLDFAGGRFLALGATGLLESVDATTWTTTPTNVELPWDVVVGHDDATGALVAASGAYETQRFYRSDDGTSWQAIDGAPTGHPIRRFVSGRLSAAACP